MSRKGAIRNPPCFSAIPLWSREPIEILEPDALRPVFVQHHEDEWLPEDVGASVRARGHRKAYFHWTVNDGFVQF